MFSLFPEFKDHLFFTHGEDTNFPCPCCDVSYTTKRSVRVHIRKKHFGSTAVCKHCGKTFNNGWQLYLHHEEVHAIEEPTTAAGVSKRIGTDSCDPLIAYADSNDDDMEVEVRDREVELADTEVKVAETEATLTGIEAVLPDKEAIFPDMEAILPDTETIVPDTEAILPDMEVDACHQEAVVADKPTSVQKVSNFKGSCDDCGRTYTTRDLLVGHAYRVHGKTLPGLKMYTCPVCDTLFHMRLQFRAHFRRVCSKIATQEQDFRFVQILRTKIVRTRTAKVLKKTVVKEEAVKLPKVKVDKDKTAKVPKKNVETSVADVPVENLEDEAAEVPAEHFKYKAADVLNKKGKPRKCPVCCIIMSNLAYRNHFKIAHAGVPYQPAICLYPCHKCYTLCKSQDKLDYHLTKKHGEEKKYVCDECGEKFAYKTALFVHGRNKHTEEACVCDECGETFDRKYKLTSHRTRKHPRGPTPTYSCPECDVTYTTREGLARHNAVTHGIGKIPRVPRQCEDCEKMFVFKDNLCAHAYKAHGKTLPGLKMFTCPVCCKLFHVKVQFQIHVETHSKLMKSKARKK
jgi:transcription elongation factor Elf1